MSFLKGLFKKKEGGTLFGNLLRKVVSTASGGMLGNGKNMLPAPADDSVEYADVIDTTTNKKFDLNDYVTLPKVKGEFDLSTPMKIGLGAGLLILLISVFKSKK